MKERPILFSGAMVRALLAGTKTQTRRIAKGIGDDVVAVEWGSPEVKTRSGESEAGPEVFAAWGEEWHVKSPYGAPGDRLWCRETWRVSDAAEGEITYRANDEARRFVSDQGGDFWRGKARDPKWRPSIFMPRWASRLTLEVVSVRVERLCDISEADAKAEGIAKCNEGGWHGWGNHGEHGTWCHDSARLPYADLWNHINGDGAWALSPWVWVIEFRRAR